jgi:hypothetical protein
MGWLSHQLKCYIFIAQSADEVAFVQEQAQQLQLRCYTRRWDQHSSWLTDNSKGLYTSDISQKRAFAQALQAYELHRFTVPLTTL